MIRYPWTVPTVYRLKFALPLTWHIMRESNWSIALLLSICRRGAVKPIQSRGIAKAGTAGVSQDDC